MADYEVNYVDPAGVRWNLSTGAQGVLLLAEGVTDLRPHRATEGLKLAGVPGQVVRPGSARVEPVSATLRVLLDSVAAKRPMKQLWPAWHRAWSFDAAGRLEYVHPDYPTVPRWMALRLGDEGISQPSRSPLDQSRVEVAVPVVSDAGLFFETGSSAALSVTVTNKGVCLTWPRLRWKGAGGTLKLPSDAPVAIPPATSERVLYLDPVESGVVVDTAGRVDEPLWARVRSGFISEPVPPGGTRTFGLFEGARLEWDIGFDTPWRL